MTYIFDEGKSKGQVVETPFPFLNHVNQASFASGKGFPNESTMNTRNLSRQGNQQGRNESSLFDSDSLYSNNAANPTAQPEYSNDQLLAEIMMEIKELEKANEAEGTSSGECGINRTAPKGKESTSAKTPTFQTSLSKKSQQFHKPGPQRIDQASYNNQMTYYGNTQISKDFYGVEQTDSNIEGGNQYQELNHVFPPFYGNQVEVNYDQPNYDPRPRGNTMYYKQNQVQANYFGSLATQISVPQDSYSDSYVMNAQKMAQLKKKGSLTGNKLLMQIEADDGPALLWGGEEDLLDEN
jgi:hypothetical protein